MSAPAAYNYAMQLVSSDILGFIDADAKVERDWLQKIVKHLDDPKVAGASGDIETWNNENLWARSIGYDLKNRYARLEKSAVRIATMNLLLKKEIIEEVGGFDEKLPSQYDTDLGFRITSKGYRIVFDPNAKCYHYNRSTVKSYFKQQLQYGKNTARLYLKHHDLIKGDKITDFGMNIQPFIILSILLLAIAGAVEILRPLWYVAALILFCFLVYVLFSALKLSIKFRDRTAMLMTLLYLVRAAAWFTGAVITTFELLQGEGKKNG